MEHGVLGEARTRALLAERFWILERSVDVEGADFLIQRRLTAKTWLDREAPRLGVVQSKFVHNDKTEVLIKSEYVMSPEAQPYEEFFLLVHTGKEDHSKLHCLSGNEIVEKCAPPIERRGSLYYRLPGRTFTSGQSFEISAKRALDQIEHALKIADFLKNRRLLDSYSSYVQIDPDHIEFDYKLPIPNHYGDIPQNFYKLKERARKLSWELEEALDALSQMQAATDPLEYERVYEDSLSSYVGRFGRLSFGGFHGADLYDEDLFVASKHHQECLRVLRDAGKLEVLLEFQRRLDTAIRKQLTAIERPDEDTHYLVEVSYDQESFEFGTFRGIVKVNALDRRVLGGEDPAEPQPGLIRYRDNISDWRYYYPVGRKIEVGRDWIQSVDHNAPRFASQVFSYLASKFGVEVV